MAYYISIDQVFGQIFQRILALYMESVIKWFQSYLSNWKFFITLENVFSDARLINCGVPHESILGPLLFLIYVNDLPQTLNETGSYLYAEDTCIFYKIRVLKK